MNHSIGRTPGYIHSVRAGPRGAAPVVLLHAASLDLTYWDAQFEVLSETHDVVAFDWPGHGCSGPITSPARFEDWAEAVATIVRETNAGPAHVVGISMGSMVAQYFALRYPALVRSLGLLGSACTLAEPVREAMRARAAKARQEGMSAVLATATGHWFTPEFRQRRPDVIDRVEKTFLAFDPEQYALLWEMVASLETRERLVKLTCPTLVLAGEHDASTPPAAARVLGEQIAGAQVEVVPGAAHLVAMEAPVAVNQRLQAFFAAVQSTKGHGQNTE